MTDPDVTVSLFATRWITHVCAPVFVLLAGVSGGLMLARRDPVSVARFLFTRGVWLIAVEVFVISTLTTFAPGVADVDRVLVADAQTSGGLLMAVPREREAELLDALRAAGTPAAARIGTVVAGAAGRITVA